MHYLPVQSIQILLLLLLAPAQSQHVSSIPASIASSGLCIIRNDISLRATSILCVSDCVYNMDDKPG